MMLIQYGFNKVAQRVTHLRKQSLCHVKNFLVILSLFVEETMDGLQDRVVTVRDFYHGDI